MRTETLAQVFSCDFCEIFDNAFSKEHLWWLLLYLKGGLSPFKKEFALIASMKVLKN